MADPKVRIIVEADDSQAKKLEKTLKDLKLAADAIASAMNKAADASAKQDTAQARAAISAQKLATAQAQTALAQQRVSTEAERTAAAHLRAAGAQDRAAQSANKLSAADAEVARVTAQGEKELAKYERQLARTATAKGDAAEKAARLKMSTEKLLETLRNVTFAAGVLGTTFSKAFDMAEQGAQITQTAIAFEHFSTSIAGVPDLLEQLNAGAAGTISEFELMRSTMTLVAGTTQEAGAGLARAAPQLLEIARAAQILNPALGDTTYFYESLATGIKRLEPRWIDNLGLIVRARDAYAKHAQALGISTQALTAEQKSQAFLNEVLRVGNLLIEQNGGAVSSAVDPYSRFRVEIEEAGNALKQFLAEGLLPYIQLINGEFSASSDATIKKNQEAALSLEELTKAYQDLEKQAGIAAGRNPIMPTFFVDDPETIAANMEVIRREMALAAGSFEEFVAAMTGRNLTNVTYTLQADSSAWAELRTVYDQATEGIHQYTRAVEEQKTGLAGYAPVQEQSIELTEEQAEALQKLKEQWADVAVEMLKSAGDLNEFGTGLLAAADGADLASGRIFKLAAAMGILSESELKAAQNAYEFQQIQAKLMEEFARTGDIQAFTSRITAAAQRLGIDYQTAAQKAAQATQLLTLAAGMGAGSFVRFAQGLGIAANNALNLKKANDAASQSVQRLATVSSGAASAFINALEGGMSGGGGGSGIDAAVQKQQEWNQAFATSFMQLLDAEEPIENWNAELLKSAAAAGASAETLQLLAVATGDYSEEQIANALKGAAMRQAIEEISSALVDGRATTEEALAAVAGFQDQLAQGGSLKLDLQAYGIEELNEATAGAGGGAGSAAAETQNWTDNLLKLASQGKLTAEDLVLLAGATGKYSDAQIQAALKTLLMQQKLEELSQQIGKRPMQAIIEDLREFESDLEKEFLLQFGTGDTEEAIERVHRGLERLPTEIDIKINIKADPIPDLSGLPGAQNPLSGSAEATQFGGPLLGANIVGEVRPELIVGGQVIPRIPPGYLMAQDGFAQAVAMAMANTMSSLPSYTNTTNINRSNTVNNNQRQLVINAPTTGAFNNSTAREIGAF